MIDERQAAPVRWIRELWTSCNRFAEKLMIVLDVKELGINTIDDKVVEFFNPLLSFMRSRVFAQKLSEERKHPLTVRRYMWKLEY